MKRDVKNIAGTCKRCKEFKASNPKEKLLHHEEASYPFKFVHMDLASYEGR
jgi:hypothetical protein